MMISHINQMPISVWGYVNNFSACVHASNSRGGLILWPVVPSVTTRATGRSFDTSVTSEGSSRAQGCSILGDTIDKGAK